MTQNTLYRLWLIRWRWRLRSWVGLHPRLYFPLQAARRRRREFYVRRNTEVVIEGYPRSGNTFAVMAFRVAQDRPVRIAHHLHMPAQLKAAARWGIPTMVLIRNPEDAVLSFLVREPRIPPEQALRDYLTFYTWVQRLRPHLVLVPFEVVISDFGRAIEVLNQRFGTRFRPFVPTSANLAQVFRLIEEFDRQERLLERKKLPAEITIGRPSEMRERLKAQRRRDLVPVQDLLDRTHKLYERLLQEVDVALDREDVPPATPKAEVHPQPARERLWIPMDEVMEEISWRRSR